MKRFAMTPFTHGTRHPQRLPTGKTSIALVKHRPNLRSVTGYDQIGGCTVSQELSQQPHMRWMVGTQQVRMVVGVGGHPQGIGWRS